MDETGKDKEKEYQDRHVLKIERPNSLNLERPTMDIGVNEMVEVIDLCTPNVGLDEPSTTSTLLQNSTISTEMTVRFSHLGQRISILPLFPTCHQQELDQLLLANTPPQQLTQIERVRRYSGFFRPAFNIVNANTTIPSFLRDKYQLFFGDLMERLKVDMSILDCNYLRLNQYLKMLIQEQIEVFYLRPHEIEVINEKEYPLALEFFLQFDVKIFYMKTCSFRFARPRSMHEGLFCAWEPEARYELIACGNCGLCYPQYDMTHRLQKAIVQFSQTHQHTFVNGYRAILNCSASCQTRNIVYALTCPCGTVDYVGATMCSLEDRLKKHREHGNRIMHEFLLGQINITRDMLRPKTNEVLMKDRMKLYQHSARCSVAMQLFLDANPQYWRFLPMTQEESERPEQVAIQRPIFSDELDWNLRSREDTRICIEAVPIPPASYVFSNRQIVLQTQYFHKKRDVNLPNPAVDLYNATIVAILPENCSEMFRCTVESLFITHADTKLNSIGNVLKPYGHDERYPLDNPWLVRSDQWCQRLLRRPQPKTTTSI